MDNYKRSLIVQRAYAYLCDKEVEHQIILFFDRDEEVQVVDISSTENARFVQYSLEKLLTAKSSYNLKGKTIITAHNHPSGSNEPSSMDYVASKEFHSLLNLNGIEFDGELIVTKKGVSSFSVPDAASSFSHFEELLFEPQVEQSHSSLGIEIIDDNNLYLSSLQNLISNKLNQGFELAFIDNKLYFSKQFSFEQLLEATNHGENVIIFGIPRYRTNSSWQRIQDIENTFGSIEFYSTDEEQLISLKKEMLL